MALRRARWAFLIFATLLLLLQPAFTLVRTAQADTTDSLVSSNLAFSKLGETPADGLLGDFPCTDMKVNVVRNVLNNFVANEEQHCMYTTLYGLTDGTIIQPNGFGKAYPIGNQVLSRAFLRPVPNQESMLLIWGDPIYPGVDISLYKNFFQHLHFNNLLQRFDLSDSPDLNFHYSSGQNIPFNYGTISFSASGQYFVADVPYKGFVRVNLATLSITPFAKTLILINGYGLNTAPTAIDNSGRYATVAYGAFSGWGDPYFQIIDVDACNSVMATSPNTPMTINCPTADDTASIKQGINGFKYINGIAFANETTLLADVKTADGSMNRYSITPSGAVPRLEDYLAMGDSYISGEGAFAYRDGTDTNENKCHQSTLSYPYLIGETFESFASVACSGALIDNVIGANDGNTAQLQDHRQSTVAERQDAQITHMPGYDSQETFITQDNPQAVTISIGGNDVGFKDILTRCIVPFNAGTSTAQTCYQTYEDRLELLNTIDEQFNRLVQTYQNLKGADPTRRVYVIGYPQIVSATGSCGLNVRLNGTERVFANQLIDYLDSVIEKASARAGVMYVNTQQSLDGHKLCQDGIKAVNGLTAGDDKLILGNESYHPNALGHQLLEATIMSATDGLKVPMPSADTAIEVQKPTDSLPILQLPKTNRAINEVLNAGQDILGVVAGSSLDPTLSKFNDILAPNTLFDAVLHSDPTDLGMYRTDANGMLTSGVAIPAGTPAGFHTLHFYGKDIAGNAIDIQQTVYVKASADDFDGDGAPNPADSCQYMPNSGLDVDQDGVDDACDPDIGPAPTAPASQDPKSNDGQGTTTQTGTDIEQPAAKLLTVTPTLLPVANASSITLADRVQPADSEAYTGASVLGATTSNTDTVTKNEAGVPSEKTLRKANTSSHTYLLAATSLMVIALLGFWYIFRR